MQKYIKIFFYIGLIHLLVYYVDGSSSGSQDPYETPNERTSSGSSVEERDPYADVSIDLFEAMGNCSRENSSDLVKIGASTKKPKTLVINERNHLLFSLVRIGFQIEGEALDKDGKPKTHYGTGFLWGEEAGSTGEEIYLVTNKHVAGLPYTQGGKVDIQNHEKNPHDFEVTFHVSNDGMTSSNSISVTFTTHDWIFHPGLSIDLCALQIDKHLSEINRLLKNVRVVYRLLNDGPYERGTGVRCKEILSKLSPGDTIFMVGYPDGLCDSINNLPLFRKGAISSDPQVDYNGKREFLADMECTPGSSGSPVVLRKKIREVSGVDYSIENFENWPAQHYLLGVLHEEHAPYTAIQFSELKLTDDEQKKILRHEAREELLGKYYEYLRLNLIKNDIETLCPHIRMPASLGHIIKVDMLVELMFREWVIRNRLELPFYPLGEE